MSFQFFFHTEISENLIKLVSIALFQPKSLLRLYNLLDVSIWVKVFDTCIDENEVGVLGFFCNIVKLTEKLDLLKADFTCGSFVIESVGGVGGLVHIFDKSFEDFCDGFGVS